MASLSSPTEAAFPLTVLDREVLSMTDDQFQPHTWDELSQIIKDNKLELFKRWPSDLRGYMQWSADTKREYGSLTTYLCEERLHWKPLPETEQPRDSIFAYTNPTPFADHSDYKILRNDWPYGFAPGITHICIWLKNRVPYNPASGQITAEGRGLIEKFVQSTFVHRLGKEGEDKVLWFKNWTALQSVKSLEHVHVLVRDVPAEILAEWTQ